MNTGLRIGRQRAQRIADRFRQPARGLSLQKRSTGDHVYAKRGGGGEKLSLDDATIFSEERASDLVALDDALNSLAAFDARKCRIIELRFFGGLTLEETAEMLGLSITTVGKEQRMAEAWLHREVSRSATA